MAPATRPSFYARWLSPEGYLGLHLVVGFVVALLAGWLFGRIADWVFDSEAIRAADRYAQQVAASWRSPALTSVMKVLSWIGKDYMRAVIVAPVVVALVRARSHRRLYAFAASILGGVLLVQALKAVFRRARPSDIDVLSSAHGYSFPSGHAMGAMLLYGSLAYVVYFSMEHHRRLRVLAVTLCVLMILTIGASRIYLGVHYLSDVIAGFAAGLCWLAVCLSGTEAWVRWRDWRRRRVAAARKAREGAG
jgi:undecaprenyl-diphosphatase